MGPLQRNAPHRICLGIPAFSHNVYVVTFIYTVYDTDYTVIHMYRHCMASLLTVPNSLHRFRSQPWAVLTMIHAVILSLPSLAIEFKLIPAPGTFSNAIMGLDLQKVLAVTVTTMGGGGGGALRVG